MEQVIVRKPFETMATHAKGGWKWALMGFGKIVKEH
jgi:hypothetical protein